MRNESNELVILIDIYVTIVDNKLKNIGTKQA
jgi:hypothetical protein